jgi:hypothetical protein
MSNNKIDKGKIFKKIHKLQKQLYRSKINEGNSEDKTLIRNLE